MTKKCFLLESLTEGANKGRKWWKLDSAKQCKTVEKKMNTYLKEWEGSRKFAIVKAENAKYAKIVLRDANHRRQIRDNSRKYGFDRSDKLFPKRSYFGEIIKMREK